MRRAPTRLDALVPPVGVEPTHLAVPDFESGASTSSTTGASKGEAVRYEADGPVSNPASGGRMSDDAIAGEETGFGRTGRWVGTHSGPRAGRLPTNPATSRGPQR